MLRTMGMVGLIFGLVLSPVSWAAVGKGDPAKAPAKLLELKPLEPRVTLGGQAGPPSYLKFPPEVMVSLEGTTHGVLRTVETDFASKDFIMDVVMKFEKGENEFIAGLGEGTRDGNWITNSFSLRWGQRGSTLIIAKNKENKGVERLDAVGVNLIRIEHKGDVLSFTVGKRDGEAGLFKAVESKSFTDFKKSATFLSDKNAAIFFGGDGTVMSVALSVDGKMVDPGTPAADAKSIAAMATEAEKTPLTSLAGAAGFPSWLSGSPNVVTDSQGVADGEVRTRETDLIDKDFVCDLLFTLEKDVKGATPIIGLGENGRDGAWILNSAYIKVHGVDDKGKCILGVSNMRDERSLGSIGDSSGPHLMRIEKHGAALTIGVCADYKDKYVPTFAKTIPDIRRAAPFLNKLNSSLFFLGGAATRLQAMRLVVDGKAAESAKEAVAKTGEDDAAIDKMPLISLAGQSGLPPWLKANARALADNEGIRGGELRSVDHDLILKDFTFDLLYEFKENEDAHILIGLGENGRNGGWILNSVLAHVTGPASDGQIMFNPSSERIDHPFIGHTAKATGPHMFRLQKRGNTLTMAVCADYKDRFETTFSKTIPDLAAVAKFLNKTNSTIFVMGNCTLKAARLVVNGKPAEGGSAMAAASGGAGDAASGAHGGETAAAGIEDKTPLISLAGQAGLPAWLKGNNDALAGPQGIDRGELRTAAQDLIKHDFTFDVLYQTKEDSPATLIGIGENGRNGGAIINSLLAFVHGPRDDGRVTLLLDDQFHPAEIGRLGKETGPFLFRMQKRGRTLTFSVDSRYDGKKFNAEFSRSIPDLPTVAPYLTSTNSTLFIEVHTAIKAVRLIVDGKPATGARSTTVADGTSGAGTTPGTKATETPAMLSGEEHLLALSGPKLPAIFTQQRGLKYVDGALLLEGQHVRTIRSDFIGKDFTFDVLYRIAPGEHEAMVVGMGENGREGAWITNSVAGVLHGPADDGLVQLLISKVSSADLGKSGKGAGPVMFRLQKRGNSLTMAVCPDYHGVFEPALSRTVPDVVSLAPFLTAKNSYLFFSGKATIEKVRLVVAGEATESADVVLGLPRRVVAGRLLKLKLPASDKSGRATYAIEIAPKGLTLSATGDLAWMPGADQQGEHEVRIKVIRPKETLIVLGEVEVVSAEDAKAVNGDLAKVESLYRLPVESEHYQYTSGLDGKSMLLLDGDSLRRLGRDGITVTQTLKLPAKYVKIGERESYFVALSDEKKSLDIIDKATLAVKKRIQMVYRNRWDLALNPAKAICYVTVEKDIEGARDAVLIVDEASGDVFEPESFVGHWIKVAPDGKTAYTGYTDTYKRGAQLLVNPDHVQLVPDYRSIDILYVWDIETNKPRCTGMKGSPGLNGFGLALSADGKRLSYLSFTGYPLYSHDIPGFDPTNFDKRPVTYPTKDNKAESKDLAYHPWLEIAAAPSEDGAVCFDRESGEVLAGLLNLNAPPLGEVKAAHVYFSADGRNLLIECDNGADRFLRKVKLNLTAAQVERMEKLEKEGRQLPKPELPREGLPKV